MSSDVNIAILIGHIGAIDVRKTTTGAQVVNIRLATNSSWTKNSEKKEETTWHNVVVFGQPAEFAAKYAKKGNKCFIEGRIQTKSYDAKDGTKKEKSEIMASVFKLLDGPSPANESGKPFDVEDEAIGAAKSVFGADNTIPF